MTMTYDQALDVLKTVTSCDAAMMSEAVNLNRVSWLVSEAAAGRIWTGDKWHHAQSQTIVTEAYKTGITALEIMRAHNAI